MPSILLNLVPVIAPPHSNSVRACVVHILSSILVEKLRDLVLKTHKYVLRVTYSSTWIEL